jgi:hypothetical protein
MSGNEGSPTAGEAAARLDRLLERITQDVGAHIGLTYLLVPDRQVLQMTTVIGAPRRLAWPWARLALAAPASVPEAVRSRRPVWLSDQQAFALRFPGPLSPFRTPSPITPSRWLPTEPVGGR